MNFLVFTSTASLMVVLSELLNDKDDRLDRGWYKQTLATGQRGDGASTMENRRFSSLSRCEMVE